MMKKTMTKRMRMGLGLVLSFSLLISLLSGGTSGAKKAAKVKKLEIRTTDSRVLVMKKKERVTLKIAVNGKVSKTAWKGLKFHSKNKKVVKVDKKGKLTAKKKGSSKITITAKKGKKRTTLKVIVGTKVKSVQMNSKTNTLLEGQTLQLGASVMPVNASYKKLRWTSSNPNVAVVTDGTARALRAGQTTITAMALDGTRKKAVCQITVNKAAAGENGTGVKITPNPDKSDKPTNSPAATSTAETTNSPAATNSPTATATNKPTATATNKPTATPTNKPTATATNKPMATPTNKPTATATNKPAEGPTATPVSESLLKNNCNTMTTSGKYASAISSPFDGVQLCANEDGCTTSYSFSGTNKKYRIVVKGASNNSTTASASVYVGGTKRGSVSFTGTELQSQSVDFKLLEETGELEIKFLLETDNGNNDTYLNSFELIYLGDIPEPPAAPVPVGGAAYTGAYRNMFKEAGYSEAEITEKVNTAWQKLFYGTEDERIFYPVGDDMAYIYTADTKDVRSEGMSYGMMICVQMDKQKEFNKLWKWAKTYMQHTSGEFKGYFAWKCNTSGGKDSDTPASDGEEYFATALLFASARWGDGEGIYNYNAEAQQLLNDMYYHDNGSVTVNSMFNSTYKMPVFCPIGNSMNHTDPSYHLPAFYEVWALCADEHNDFWSEAAEASRQHFKDATNKTTGLGPDYSNYDGSPTGGNHADFRFDAWRIAGNIACDYAWWGKDSWATTHADRIQGFFAEKGVEDYGNQWSLDGKELDKDHSPGLVAMNSVASLAASKQVTWQFLENFWNISPTTGEYRYYDGCLYMMGLLHCSGNFRVYLPGGNTAAPSSTITPTTAEFDKEETKQDDITVGMTLNGNTLSQIKNGSTVLTAGSDYSINGTEVVIRKSYLSTLNTGSVTLTFVFSAGRNAKLRVTIKDTTPGAAPSDPSGPFEQISAAASTESNGVTVSEGIVTFNSTDSWIAFNLDFGTDSVQNAVVYVKEPDNGGQVYVYMDSLSKQVSTIYNCGNGSWNETQNNCSITSGTHKVYVKANKAGMQMEWIKFTKK